MGIQTTASSHTQIVEPFVVVDNHLIYKKKKIAMDEVIAIRYGWKPIELDMFTIGTRFMLELRTEDNRIQINFRSFLGLFKQRLYARADNLVTAVWDLTVIRLLNILIDDIRNGRTAQAGKCTVTPSGVIYKDFLIEWEDLSYQKNYNKLTINSKSNPSIWTNLYYTETDNIHILGHFLDWKFSEAT